MKGPLSRHLLWGNNSDNRITSCKFFFSTIHNIWCASLRSRSLFESANRLWSNYSTISTDSNYHDLFACFSDKTGRSRITDVSHLWECLVARGKSESKKVLNLVVEQTELYTFSLYASRTMWLVHWRSGCLFDSFLELLTKLHVLKIPENYLFMFLMT